MVKRERELEILIDALTNYYTLLGYAGGEDLPTVVKKLKAEIREDAAEMLTGYTREQKFLREKEDTDGNEV